MHDHYLILALAPLATCHFECCGIQSWHLYFMKPREAMLNFLLAFSLLATSQVSMSSSHALISRIPEIREVNGLLNPSSRRCMFTCQSRGPHLVVLPRVPCAQRRHFTTSLPEVLPPLYPDTRSAEILNSSLLLSKNHDFETFRT
jgi:hypothetical protein